MSEGAIHGEGTEVEPKAVRRGAHAGRSAAARECPPGWRPTRGELLQLRGRPWQAELDQSRSPRRDLDRSGAGCAAGRALLGTGFAGDVWCWGRAFAGGGRLLGAGVLGAGVCWGRAFAGGGWRHAVWGGQPTGWRAGRAGPAVAGDQPTRGRSAGIGAGAGARRRRGRSMPVRAL